MLMNQMALEPLTQIFKKIKPMTLILVEFMFMTIHLKMNIIFLHFQMTLGNYGFLKIKL